MQRRAFLKTVSSAALAALSGLSPLAALASASREDEFFVFIFALGGWDVTLWADPRNELQGIIHPASTENTDTGPLRLWKDAPLDEGARTFELLRPSGQSFALGPGIGELFTMVDRLTIINGLEMNTVAHPDGQTFSATGRHLQGGRAINASVDTMLANELGREQLLPSVSVRFPSAYVGENLDRRVVPLAIGDVGSISRTLSRASLFDTAGERDRVTALLSEEASDLARHSTYPDVLDGVHLQYESLRKMLGGSMQDVFSADGLRKAHPEYNYKARFASGAAMNASFAVEAMKRNVVRCLSFATGSFDTHGNNYRSQAQNQQELFDLVAALLRTLDATAHPTKTGHKLSDHTHILVLSDFCRTPQLNLALGRDHYPNNSALVVSPLFRSPLVFGKTDAEQLLPVPTRTFADGPRAIAPPDLLATFLSAFAIDPRKYMRDGEVVSELLRA
jgi:Protein of unknown function (DUF1501)